MPSGKTHDQLTWIGLPLSLLGSWLLSQDLLLSLLLGGSFVFAGLMFSGDLDVKSVQYKRWGWLRWIWIPYQRGISHRSPLSHGPVLGTLTRLLYLSIWVLALFWIWTQLALVLQQTVLLNQSQLLIAQGVQFLQAKPAYLVAILAGLWLGALSHTLADEIVSHLKRFKRRRKRKKK